MPTGQSRIYYVVGAFLADGAREPAHRAAATARHRGAAARRPRRRVDDRASARVRWQGPARCGARAIWSLARSRPSRSQPPGGSRVKENKALLKHVKDALGERVTEVRVATRLTDSPACLVLAQGELSPNLRRAAGSGWSEVSGEQAPARVERRSSAGAAAGCDSRSPMRRRRSSPISRSRCSTRHCWRRAASWNRRRGYVARLNRLLLAASRPAAGHG